MHIGVACIKGWRDGKNGAWEIVTHKACFPLAPLLIKVERRREDGKKSLLFPYVTGGRQLCDKHRIHKARTLIQIGRKEAQDLGVCGKALTP